MNNELRRAAIYSCAVHVTCFLLMLFSGLPIKMNRSNVIEVEIAGVGDTEKNLGGTGQGNLDTAQPMESVTDTRKESEIEPGDSNTDDAKGKGQELTPVSENNNVVNNGSVTGAESIPLKTHEKKQQKDDKKQKSDKVDRPPKRKKNSIIDLVKKQKNSEQDFDDLLKSIDNRDVLKTKKKRYNVSSKVKGEGGGGGGDALSGSDYDTLKKQIMPHWFVPTGMKDYESYVVRLRISVNDDGSLRRSDVEIEDIDRYNRDRLYRIAVDSAIKAVLLASPLRLPKNVLRRLKKFLVVFDPKDAI